MVKFFKRRKLFDEDADWLPQKGRAFKMKTKMQKEEPEEESLPKGSKTKGPKKDPFRMTAEPPDIKYDFKRKEPRDNIKTDAEGMDRAYAQGDVYGEGNKEYVAGSHTFTDWFDDFTKIPQWRYVPPGLNPIVDILNSVWGRQVFGTGDLRQSERYKRARDYLVAHPEVTFLDGHSLGGAVVLQLQKDFPERKLKTFTQGAPVLDLLGTQKAEIGAENVMRVSNNGDIVSAFDRSAKKTNHPDALSYGALWHDYHNKEQAGGTLEGVPIQDNTVKTTWDTQPFNPLNINKNLTYDKTEGTKMTE